MSVHVDKPWAFVATRAHRLRSEAKVGRRDPARAARASRAAAYAARAADPASPSAVVDACKSLAATYGGASVVYFNGAAREAHEARLPVLEPGLRHVSEPMGAVINDLTAIMLKG